MSTEPLLPVMINDLLKNTDGERSQLTPVIPTAALRLGESRPLDKQRGVEIDSHKKRSLPGEGALLIIADDQ